MKGERGEIAPDAVIDSSGNVFADLNLPHSDEDMLKMEIAWAIAATVRKRDLARAEAAAIVGTDQAKFAALLRGRLRDFSADRLIKYLLLIGNDIDIRISDSTGGRGTVKVSQAA